MAVSINCTKIQRSFSISVSSYPAIKPTAYTVQVSLPSCVEDNVSLPNRPVCRAGGNVGLMRCLSLERQASDLVYASSVVALTWGLGLGTRRNWPYGICRLCLFVLEACQGQKELMRDQAKPVPAVTTQHHVVCRRMWGLLQLHAKQCQAADCPVPRCRELREMRRRQMSRQEDARRHAYQAMLRQQATNRQQQQHPQQAAQHDRSQTPTY